jgi:hypothetical protein
VTTSVEDWYYRLAGGVPSVKARASKSLSILVCLTIWCERNTRIFNGKEKGIPRLITKIKDEASFWFTAGAKSLGCIVAQHRNE